MKNWNWKWKLIGVVIILSGLLAWGILSSQSSRVTKKNTEYVLAGMTNCFKGGGSRCYKELAQDFSKKLELPVILTIFEQNEGRQEVFSRCHEVTHYLGRNEFMKSKSVPDTFEKIIDVCHNGAYHGVIEGYFIDKNIALDNIEVLTREVKNICGQRSDYKRATVYGECVHGIGHAMMFVTEGELVKSLSMCDSLAIEDRVPCYGGVFMENSSSSTNTDHPPKYVKADDPLYPCSILEEKYLETCYSYQSSHFAKLSSHDWLKVIALCQSVPERYQMGCFKIMGTNQVGFSQDMLGRKSNCELIPSLAQRRSCLNGVVDGLVGRYHRDFDMTISFCSILEEGDKKDCYKTAGQALSGWVESPQELVTKCGRIPEEAYVKVCVSSRSY